MSDLQLVAVQIDETPLIMVPLTGQLLDLTSPFEVAGALRDVRDVKRQLDELRAFLEGVLRLEAQRQGTKTLHLGALDAVMSGGTRATTTSSCSPSCSTRRDCRRNGLREAIVETVSYKVNQLVLKQLAGANPDYAAAIELCETQRLRRRGASP